MKPLSGSVRAGRSLYGVTRQAACYPADWSYLGATAAFKPDRAGALPQGRMRDPRWRAPREWADTRIGHRPCRSDIGHRSRLGEFDRSIDGYRPFSHPRTISFRARRDSVRYTTQGGPR